MRTSHTKLDLHRIYHYELESKQEEIDKLKAEIKKLKEIIGKNINYIKLT
jgi:peptidoglycan hydrolase CwlO-like protein